MLHSFLSHDCSSPPISSHHNIVLFIGNIGSGKTTLLSHVRDILQSKNLNQKIIFLKEPVDVWETIKDDDGKTMLEKFYADQEKYSFAFQMMVSSLSFNSFTHTLTHFITQAYISRLQLLRDSIKANPGAIIITERSLYTDKMVFAKMLFEQGKIESVQVFISPLVLQSLTHSLTFILV